MNMCVSAQRQHAARFFFLQFESQTIKYSTMTVNLQYFKELSASMF